MQEITTQLVKRLIARQFPQWSALEVRPVRKSGHDNRTFHLGNEMAVRLPSGADYVPQVEKEARWLPFLAERLSLPISTPVAQGRPDFEYPFPWSVNRYLEGETAEEGLIPDKKAFAADLAAFLRALQRVDTAGAPVGGRHNFYRGASLAVYDGETQEALDRLKAELPTEKLRRIWLRALSSQWKRDGVWIHGDVAPGNLLVKAGRLSGVIDFGIMGVGDPACDYAMAWTFFDEESRSAFLDGLDDSTIDRARGWALWKALITYKQADGTIHSGARDTIDNLLRE